MSILLWLIGPVGRYVSIALVASMAFAGIYGKGRMDGKAAYQAKLEREIKAAINKGDSARTDALKKFDSNKEIENDGFSRD